MLAAVLQCHHSPLTVIWITNVVTRDLGCVRSVAHMNPFISRLSQVGTSLLLFLWLKACKHTWCAALQFDPVAPRCVIQNKLYIYLPRLLILSNTMRSKRIVLHCSPLHVFTSLQPIRRHLQRVGLGQARDSRNGSRNVVPHFRCCMLML